MVIGYNPAFKDNIHVRTFIGQIPRIFDSQGKLLFTGRNTIKSYTLDPADEILREVVVKRYKRPRFIQRLVYSLFRPTKAARAFRNAAELSRRGISTPCGIAYIEQKKYGIFTYGYFITSYDGTPPIAERLNELPEFDRRLAADFAAFAAALHDKGILHHDLNSTNVRYHNREEGYGFSVIDINRMKIYPPEVLPGRAACMENLTRFTGRMDLFEYVARCYIRARAWEEKELERMLRIKRTHDRKWERRKAFFRKIKGK